MKMRNKLFFYSILFLVSLFSIGYSATASAGQEPFQMGFYQKRLDSYPLNWATKPNGALPFVGTGDPCTATDLSLNRTRNGNQWCRYAIVGDGGPYFNAYSNEVVYYNDSYQVSYYNADGSGPYSVNGVTFTVSSNTPGKAVGGLKSYEATWTRSVAGVNSMETKQHALNATNGSGESNMADYTWGTIVKKGFELNCGFAPYHASLTLLSNSNAALAGATLVDWKLRQMDTPGVWVVRA